MNEPATKQTTPIEDPIWGENGTKYHRDARLWATSHHIYEEEPKAGLPLPEPVAYRITRHCILACWQLSKEQEEGRACMNWASRGKTGSPYVTLRIHKLLAKAPGQYNYVCVDRDPQKIYTDDPLGIYLNKLTELLVPIDKIDPWAYAGILLDELTVEKPTELKRARRHIWKASELREINEENRIGRPFNDWLDCVRKHLIPNGYQFGPEMTTKLL